MSPVAPCIDECTGVVISRLEPLMASSWPQDITPGMLQQPSTPRRKGSKVHPKTALSGRPRRTSLGTVWHHVSMQPSVVALARRPWATHPPKAAHPATWRGRCPHAGYLGGRTPQRSVQVARYRVCRWSRPDGPGCAAAAGWTARIGIAPADISGYILAGALEDQSWLFGHLLAARPRAVY